MSRCSALFWCQKATKQYKQLSEELVKSYTMLGAFKEKWLKFHFEKFTNTTHGLLEEYNEPGIKSIWY